MTDTERELADAEHNDLCPRCEGAGEIGVRQDYWGLWETEPCLDCGGTGELS